MSAGVAVFAARRRRVHHAATCRPLGLSRTETLKKRAHLLSLVVVVVEWLYYSTRIIIVRWADLGDVSSLFVGKMCI